MEITIKVEDGKLEVHVSKGTNQLAAIGLLEVVKDMILKGEVSSVEDIVEE